MQQKSTRNKVKKRVLRIWMDKLVEIRTRGKKWRNKARTVGRVEITAKYTKKSRKTRKGKYHDKNAKHYVPMELLSQV